MNNENKLTIDLILIVGKYFQKGSDYVNLMRMCKKFKELVMMYKMNPISDWSLFPNIQTQHLYERRDIYNIKPGVFRYIIHPKMLTGIRIDENNELQDDYSFQYDYLIYLTGKKRFFSYYISIPKDSLFAKIDNKFIKMDYSEFLNIASVYKNDNYSFSDKDTGPKFDKSDQTISFPYDIVAKKVYINAIYSDGFFSKRVNLSHLAKSAIFNLNLACRKWIFKSSEDFLNDMKNHQERTMNYCDFREIEHLICNMCFYFNYDERFDDMIHLQLCLPTNNGIDSYPIKLGDYEYPMIGKALFIPPSFPEIVKTKLKDVIDDYEVVYDSYSMPLRKDRKTGCLFYQENQNLTDIWKEDFILIAESNNCSSKIYDVHTKGDDRIHLCSDSNIIIQPEEKFAREFKIYMDCYENDNEDDFTVDPNNLRSEWELDDDDLFRSECFYLIDNDENELEIIENYTSFCYFDKRINRWCYSPDSLNDNTYYIDMEDKPVRLIILKRINYKTKMDEVVF